jgi:hypothetical protein
VLTYPGESVDVSGLVVACEAVLVALPVRGDVLLIFVIILGNQKISSRSRVSSNSFSSLLLVAASSSCLCTRYAGSSKLLLVGLRLILCRNNYRRGSSNLWLLQKMWAFISIICAPIYVNSTKFSFIFGANGGADCVHEWKAYAQEEDDQWTMVLPRNLKRYKSYADAAKAQVNLRGANRVPIGCFHSYHWRLQHSSIFDRIQARISSGSPSESPNGS